VTSQKFEMVFIATPDTVSANLGGTPLNAAVPTALPKAKAPTNAPTPVLDGDAAD
jgi:hypothetical protein